MLLVKGVKQTYKPHRKPLCERKLNKSKTLTPEGCEFGTISSTIILSIQKLVSVMLQNKNTVNKKNSVQTLWTVLQWSLQLHILIVTKKKYQSLFTCSMHINIVISIQFNTASTMYNAQNIATQGIT